MHPGMTDFMRKVEGHSLSGYVPCRLAGGGSRNYRGDVAPVGYTAMGASGVTIATGLDLGQRNARELEGWGLGRSLLERFRPYLGKRKAAALQALWQAPLGIDRTEAALCERVTLGSYLERLVIPAWEADAGASFAHLPWQAQTVIFSLCYHKGIAGARKGCPITWALLTAQNWQGAARELINGFSQYASRRAMEGRLLQELA